MKDYEEIDDEFSKSEAEFKRLTNKKNTDIKDKPAQERIQKYLQSVYDACRNANLYASLNGLGDYDFYEVNLAADVKDVFDLIVMNYIHDRGYHNENYPLCTKESFINSWKNIVKFIRTLCDSEKEAYIEFIHENPFNELKSKLRSDIKTNMHLTKALQASLKDAFTNEEEDFYDSRAFEQDDIKTVSAEEFKKSFLRSLSEFVIF